MDAYALSASILDTMLHSSGIAWSLGVSFCQKGLFLFATLFTHPKVVKGFFPQNIQLGSFHFKKVVFVLVVWFAC